MYFWKWIVELKVGHEDIYIYICVCVCVDNEWIPWNGYNDEENNIISFVTVDLVWLSTTQQHEHVEAKR